MYLFAEAINLLVLLKVMILLCLTMTSVYHLHEGRIIIPVGENESFAFTLDNTVPWKVLLFPTIKDNTSIWVPQ